MAGRCSKYGLAGEEIIVSAIGAPLQKVLLIHVIGQAPAGVTPASYAGFHADRKGLQDGTERQSKTNIAKLERGECQGTGEMMMFEDDNGERLKLEGETENMGVGTRDREGHHSRGTQGNEMM